MKYTRKKIYDILPAIYRQHDEENGFPLRALLDIVAEQIEIVQNDIKNLYDNWFIETCEEWVVAYIGDLLRVRIPYPVSSRTYSQRAWVANTIGYRRRKGTLAMLEALARDVTGYDTKAAEFFEKLVTTQNLNHLRLHSLATPDLRDTEKLERISLTPFNTVAHNVDVRSIRRRRGYYNIPNIGIFLWRIQSLPVHNAPAFDRGDGRFTFNRLGYDEPIYNHKREAIGVADVAEEKNICAPIRRRVLNDSIDDYYFGESGAKNNAIIGSGHDDTSVCSEGRNDKTVEKSIQVVVNGKIKSRRDIVVCNLAEKRVSSQGKIVDWVHRPEKGKIAIDPVLGRIMFPVGEVPRSVHTNHYYGFSSAIGGGFYVRPEPPQFFVVGGHVFGKNIEEFHHYFVTKTGVIPSNVTGNENQVFKTLAEAVSKWNSEGRNDAIIEIQDSEFYEESDIEIGLPANTVLMIKSSQGKQPIILLRDPIKIRRRQMAQVSPNAGEGEDSSVIASSGGKIIFDGLMFNNFSSASPNLDGNTLFNIESGSLSSIAFHHCTLVPGRDTSSLYDSKQIISTIWEKVPKDPQSISKLRSFLSKTFSGLSWLGDKRRRRGIKLKYESLPENGAIKISLSSSPHDPQADDRKPFITIEPNLDKSAAAVILHNYNANIDGTITDGGGGDDGGAAGNITAYLSIPQKVYEFVLRPEADGKTTVYCPKLSLLVTPSPPPSPAPHSSSSSNPLLTKNRDDSLNISLNSTICGTIIAATATSSLSSSPSIETEIQLNNSILDGKGSNTALDCFKSNMENSTIFGKVKLIILEMASNVMFTDIVTVRRLQQGCVRFCYIAERSRTPRRYRCQPEYFNSSAVSLKRRNNSEEEDDTLLNMIPRFTSTLYGDPGYAQLHKKTSNILIEGADNGSEIGVFNNLYQSQRVKNLRSSFDEYLRFGLEVGIFFVDYEREKEDDSNSDMGRGNGGGTHR